MTTLDQLVAKSMQLAGAGVLFVAPCRFCGPGPGMLLMHAKDGGMWELPSGDVAPDVSLDDSTVSGDVLINRCDEFEPVLGERYDDHCWTSPDYAVTCTTNHPKATAAIQQFIADTGTPLSQGDPIMESRISPREAQQKAQRVYEAFGDAEGAPAILNGESGIEHRIRLLSKYKQHSKIYKDADLSMIQDETVFSAVENAIYADAMVAANDPATYPPNVLIPRKIRDGAGREITRYIGQDGACWDQFNPRIRLVKGGLNGFNTRGASR